MAAPSTDYPALGASTSSSGFTDGLGRRCLAFDREGGTMLERLAVRAELSAFERSLRDRLDRLGALDDERLAKPRSIERAPDGSLFVFSEFVPGTRLSDLLDATAQEGTAPGVDVALGFLLDVLPALCGLHAGAGFAHGAISPGRTVLTPAGQIVLLDGIFGDALAHLQYTRRRLWTEFGIAMPPAAGPPRFDAAGDIAQAALTAVMLVVGRQLNDYDYPDGIPTLLADVVEVAQIRGSSEFADGLTTFFQRALPLTGRKPYTAADDALIDLRDLARELGLDVCRRALVEFIEGQNGELAGGTGAGYADGFVYDDLATADTNGDGTDEDNSDGTELELDLDGSRSRRSDSDETYYDLSSAEETPAEETATEERSGPTSFQDPPVERRDFSEFSALPEVPSEPAVAWKPEPEVESFPASNHESQPEGDEENASQDALASLDSVSAEPETPADTAVERESEHEEEGSVEEPQEDAKSSRRRKRARSVRSRKDKLQSAARPQKLAPPSPPPPPAPAPPVQAAPPAPAPAPVAAAKPTSSGWLVEPSKAASFDPPVPVAPVPPAPRPIALAPPAPPPPMAPIVVAPPVPPPVAIPAPPPLRPVAPVIAAPPPIPLQKPAAPVPLAPAAPPALKLKTEPPAGYAPPRRSRAEPMEDIYSPRAAAPEDSGGGGFPWKIASGGLVLLVVGLVAGRAYMTSGEPEAAATLKGRVAATAPIAPTGAPVLPKTGRIQIETEPAGARVLLDGKHVGDSPVTIEAAAGRHTLTLATSTGSVRRTVRVEMGKTLTLNVPIFSGWVDVASPIILEVSEDGKLLGTTEQNRLLLRPGRHVLTFTNRDLDYSTVQTVDIEPGEAKTLAIDPKGTVNLNATPWAEVWIDGKKVGDTPLANLEIPLGTREIVFKNQGYVEQRVTKTIRANAPLAISVEMVKQ